MAEDQTNIPDFQLPDEPASDFVLPGEEARAEREPVKDVPPSEVPLGISFGGEGYAPPQLKHSSAKVMRTIQPLQNLTPAIFPAKRALIRSGTPSSCLVILSPMVRRNGRTLSKIIFQKRNLQKTSMATHLSASMAKNITSTSPLR